MFKRSLVGLVLALMGVATSVVAASSATPSAPAPTSGIVVNDPVHHDISPPMASIPARMADVPSSRGRDRGAKLTGHGPAAPSIKSSPSAAVAVAAPTSNSFEGIGTGLPGSVVNSAPPDPNGAVSPLYYVEIVNSSYAVFNRAGGVLSGPFNTNTLFSGFGGGCQADNDGDGTVIYDRAADRWLISQFAVTTTHYLNCVAVSTTNDPRGTWARYSYFYTNLPDYPKFATWPDAYYVSFNTFAGTTFLGPMACAYDRSRMLSGLVATQQCTSLGSVYGGLLASALDGATPPPAGSPNYFVSLGRTSTTLDYWKFHVDWTTPTNSSFVGPATITVPAYSLACKGTGGACIPQKGTTNQLDTLGDRLMYRLAYRNFGDHEALVVNHSVDTATSVGVRWYELRTSGGNLVMAQSGTHAPDSNYRWMGSIAMDAVGDIGLGYSTSGTGMNPGIRYTGRTPTDPSGTLETEGTIINGTGSQTGGLTRWGDYTSMFPDPVDDCTFWYTNEYLAVNGSYNWRTRVGTFKFPGCLPAPTGLSATAVSASQINLVWSSVPGATSYNIERSSDGVTGWSQIGTSGTPNYSDTGLPPSTTFFYRVRSTSATTISSPSMLASATTTPAVWSAGYASSTPTSWTPGETKTYAVTVTNTGNQTWPAGGSAPVHLGVHFATRGGGFSTNYPWLTDQRFSLAADLAPGSSVALTASVTAPNTTANLVLEYQMVREGAFWFTQFADVNVTVGTPVWSANYAVSNPPPSWSPGQTQTYTVTVSNTGNQTWPAGGSAPVHLGVHFATSGGGFSNNYPWLTDQRFNLPADLAPNASVTISASVTAPNTTGNLVLEYQMVKESQFWFTQVADVNVTVGTPVWSAGYAVSNPPPTWTPGQTQTYTVTVTNTGNQTWPAGGSAPVHLGVHFATRGGGFSTNYPWLTDQRFNLPADLAPNGSVTLTVSVTAPNTTGNLVLEYQMVKETQFWFTQFAYTNVSVA